MSDVVMIQGHVIDKEQVISGSKEGELLKLLFRNGEVIDLQCQSTAELNEMTKLFQV